MTTESQAYEGLNEIFADVFMREGIPLKPETTAKDVDGWNSFKQIEIIMATEEKFGIKFQTRDLDSIKNVGDLVSLIAAKG